MTCTISTPTMSPDSVEEAAVRQPEFGSPRMDSRWKLPGFVRVMFWMGVVFLALEGVTRALLVPASKDFSRFGQYPEVARELLEKSGTRIGFLGNSTTQYGVDPEVVQSTLGREGIEHVHAAGFPSDASKINTWYYVASSCLLQGEKAPEVIVVNFYGNNLLDGNRIEIGRLAQFFTTVSDWPEVLKYDLPRIGDQVEFVLASGSMTLAARERIKQRVFKSLIPNYEEYAIQQNAALYQPESQVSKGNDRPVSHVTLQRLIARAKSKNVHLVFVAFPIRDCITGEPYGLRPETTEVIQQAGMDLVDLRFESGLERGDYLDELHLNDHGRAIYSEKLAEQLAPIVRRVAR